MQRLSGSDQDKLVSDKPWRSTCAQISVLMGRLPPKLLAYLL